MGRKLRPWWIALVASLLLHGLLMSGLHGKLPSWVAPADPPIYEVELVPARPALVAAPPPAAPPQPTAPKAAVVPPAPVVAEPDPPAETPAPAVASFEEPQPEDARSEPEVDPAPPPDPAPEPTTQPAPAAPDPPPLNTLPPRIDMRFKVAYGIATGEQTLVWIKESDTRYTVTSVAEATGLAGLVYRGRFVQTSRGRITPQGLQPEEFWDQRGDKRSSAHFDSLHGQLTLTPAKGVPRHFAYSGDVQDALSLFFQIALTAPPAANEFGYTVFNGKKLRNYRYEVRGVTQLETAVGPLRTLHLARVADGDGRFEVWLAVDRHYLPVRILKSDDKDNEIELTLISMTP